MREKKSNTGLRPVLRECRGEGIFYLILNFKYFINAVKFRWSTKKLLRPTNFPS